MSASALIKGHQNMMTWEVAGWHGGAALYHLEGCEKCDEYIAHVVEANSLVLEPVKLLVLGMNT